MLNHHIQILLPLYQRLKIPSSKNFYQLKNVSFTRKRLLRKKFRTNRTSSEKNVPSLSGTDETHDLFFKNGWIVKSEKRQQSLQTVHDLSSSLQYCQIKNRCDACSKWIKKSNFVRHKQSHQFQCMECPASFTTSKKLRYHSAAKHSEKSSNPKFQCLLCDLFFLTFNRVSYHKRIAHGESRQK